MYEEKKVLKRPKTVICKSYFHIKIVKKILIKGHICGREFGTTSINIHTP